MSPPYKLLLILPSAKYSILSEKIIMFLLRIHSLICYIEENPLIALKGKETRK